MPIYPSGLAGGGPCPSAGAADLPAIHLHLHTCACACTCICTLSLGQGKCLVLLHMPCYAHRQSGTMGACELPTAHVSPSLILPRLSHQTRPHALAFSALPPRPVHAFCSRFPAAPSHPPPAQLHGDYPRYYNYRPHSPTLLVDHPPAIPTVSDYVSTSLALVCFYTARPPLTTSSPSRFSSLLEVRVAVRHFRSTTIPRFGPQIAYTKRRRS